MVKPSSDISVIFIYQPPVRSEVSQKWFSHLIFSLHSQAPGCQRRDDSKLSTCLHFPLILSFSHIKEQKGESNKKSPKAEEPGSTNLNFQPPFSSPLTTQTCCLWMLKQRRRGATHIKYLRSSCQAGVKLKWSLLKNSTALQSFQ